VSRDPAVDAESLADPLASRSSTVKFGALAFAEQDRVRAAIAATDALPVPTYVLHGAADPLVPVAASARLQGKRNVTMAVHGGLRHECHHEPERDQVLDGVITWLCGTLPGAPARPAATTPAAVAVAAAARV
jgi:alpha-beta hydrolase superfamily lysophospholipase